MMEGTVSQIFDLGPSYFMDGLLNVINVPSDIDPYACIRLA